MSDFKSKLPDFKELSSIAEKLFKDLKKSVNGIIHDYKAKRTESSEETGDVISSSKTAKPKKETSPKAEPKKTTKKKEAD